MYDHQIIRKICIFISTKCVLRTISESGKGEKLIIVSVFRIPLKKAIYLYRFSEKTEKELLHLLFLVKKSYYLRLMNKT